MQVHDGQAVRMSVLGRDRSDDPDVRGGDAAAAAEEATQPPVRQLAGAMVTGQTSELTRLTELLDAWGGPFEE